MTRHLLLVFMNAVAGQDDDFNAWYDTHMLEAIQMDGWTAARRYRLAATDPPQQGAPFDYLTVYEIDDVETARRALHAARAARDAAGNAPTAFLHTASDLQAGKQMLWWSAISPRSNPHQP